MFQEIEHTADYAIHVWAEELPELFLDAARGMYALAGGRSGQPPVKRMIEIHADDMETLLVEWLEELAFLLEIEGEFFDHFDLIRFDPPALKIQVTGGPAEAVDKLIKAVTFHDLAIQETAEGYQTTIVFDV